MRVLILAVTLARAGAANAALVGPVETSPEQRLALSQIADVQIMGEFCTELAVEPERLLGLFIDAGIAPSEIDKEGRRYDVFRKLQAPAMAFLYQLAEDLKMTREAVACAVGERRYGPTGTAVPNLLQKE